MDVLSTNILPELHVGDRVTIGYYGNIAESYPPQINWTAVIYNRDEFEASYEGNTYGPFYHYKGTSEILGATLALHKDNTFDFSGSRLDCYGAAGYYELTDTTLTLITDNGSINLLFDVKDDAYLFNESKSSKLPRYRFKNSDTEPVLPVPDKAAFVPAP